MQARAQARITAGVLATILTLTSALSFAALIFSGDLAQSMHLGITAALLCAAVFSIAFALFGSLRFKIGGPGGNQAAVVALVAAAIDHTLTAEGSNAAALPTILVGIALSTIATGIFLLILGWARAGHWMRFIPYPVIGGILGAAGWLFIAGSVRVIGTSSGAELTVGIVFGLILVVATTRLRNVLTLPVLLAAGTAAFYIALLVRGIPIGAARSEGWLFSVGHGSAFANLWNPALLGAVAWPVLRAHFTDLLTIFVVTTFSVLLGTSALELVTRRDGDLDREFQVAGVANILCGLGGGFIGNVQLTNSVVTFGISGTSRVPPLMVAGFSIVALFFGATIAEAIPRFVFGALIFTVGFGLLWEWAVRAARRLPLQDYLSILAIIAVVVRFGYVAGVVTGLLIGCVIFVVTYSRVRIIKHSLTGAEFRSGIVRSPEETELLRNEGAVIRILVLQGFIFFGMSDRLYRSIQALIEAEGSMRFLVIDFRSVNGIDSSAMSSFAKLRQLVERHSVTLTFTGMSPEIEGRWVHAHGADARATLHLATLDEALERCEDELLESFTATHDKATLAEWLRSELRDADAAVKLAQFLEERDLKKGEILCSEGEPADAMFFVERGRIGVIVGAQNGRLRLRSLGDRTIIGEMGIYRDEVRSASVVAEADSIVHVLTREAFERIAREDPALAATFNAAIVRTLADRLEFENGMVVALQR